MKFNMDKFLVKISSRKFWALLAGLVGAILIAFNVDENSIAQITAIIGGFASIAIYTFSESWVDQAREKNTVEVVEYTKETIKK